MSRTRLTRYLKLRVAATLADDAKYNLERVDTLGGLVGLNSNDELVLRSKSKIYIEPASSDLGASSSSENVINFNTANTLISLNNASLDSAASLSLLNDSYKLTLAPPSSLSTDITLTLPATTGTVGQVLSTDGSGNLSWTTVAGSSADTDLIAIWQPSDGEVKTVTHGFSTRNLMVQVLDSADSYRNIEVDVSRPTNDTVVLDASAVPSNNWVVLIKKVN